MSIETQLVEIAENVPKVYNAGKEDGKKSAYDTFWDAFQNKGSGNPNYYYGFAYPKWNDTNYNPKYTIKSNNIQNAFYYSNITDTKVDIDATGATSVGGLFYHATNLITVRKLKMSNKVTGAKSTFTDCGKLKNITIVGEIACDWDTNACPLTKDSILSIFNALSTTATGKACTFNKTAVNATFTDEEWQALIATKSNWTITLK